MYSGNVITTTFMRRAALAVFLASTLAGLSACSDSDMQTVVDVDPNEVVPDPSSDNMSDYLVQNMDYGTVFRLIEDADLAEALQEDNMGLGWTLFAPNDDAFVNDSFESMTPEQKVSLIKSHIYSGTLRSTQLISGPLGMVEGSVEVVSEEGNVLSVGGATIVAKDRLVANGVVHFVDKVLDPLQ